MRFPERGTGAGGLFDARSNFLKQSGSFAENISPQGAERRVVDGEQVAFPLAVCSLSSQSFIIGPASFYVDGYWLTLSLQQWSRARRAVPRRAVAVAGGLRRIIPPQRKLSGHLVDYEVTDSTQDSLRRRAADSAARPTDRPTDRRANRQTWRPDGPAKQTARKPTDRESTALLGKRQEHRKKTRSLRRRARSTWRRIWGRGDSEKSGIGPTVGSGEDSRVWSFDLKFSKGPF